MQSKKVGTSGLYASRYASGFGRVIIPSEVSRDAYIKDCLATGYILLQGEENNAIPNVRCSASLLQEIVFPENVEELGSEVAYIVLPKHRQVVALAVLDEITGYNQLKPDTFKLIRNTDSGFALIEGDGKGNMVIAVNSTDPSRGRLYITVGNDDDSGILELDVRGSGVVKSRQSFSVESETQIELLVGDSKIEVTAEEINMLAETINHNEGSEPMVLGDSLADFLDKILSAISAITVATAIGAQPIINKVQVEQLKTELESFKSKKSKLD